MAERIVRHEGFACRPAWYPAPEAGSITPIIRGGRCIQPAASSAPEAVLPIIYSPAAFGAFMAAEMKMGGSGPARRHQAE